MLHRDLKPGKKERKRYKNRGAHADMSWNNRKSVSERRLWIEGRL